MRNVMGSHCEEVAKLEGEGRKETLDLGVAKA